ncbi:kinesin-like protein KIN-5D isoform X2 [Salvia hispanica]|uniref:kinesin-like protein KIN-5D isoform X2 n=1 Tax=Salvia hispanica TaxID=49212 RepID=UPI002009C2B3|nr:kinesin-like protein KIN-5D isoform X2 [Salvia hispanica]
MKTLILLYENPDFQRLRSERPRKSRLLELEIFSDYEASRRRGSGGMVCISPLQTTRAVRNPRLGEGNCSGKHDKDRCVNVRVIVRCRPLSEDDEARFHTPMVISCNDSRSEVCLVQSIANKQIQRTFLFDKVFGSSSQQKDLYDQAVRPIVFEVLEGYTSTIFAYGQTGTGKTYTMEGGSRKKNGNIPSDAGVIPRAIRQIFDILEAKNAEYSLKVTFLELYNEEITDLLAPEECSKFIQDKSKKPIALLKDGKGGIFVRGLEEETVTTADEIYKILEKGSAKRRTSHTILNKQSSRSHSVFSITLHIKECTPEGEEMIKCGKLNIVDLAGSENISRSGAREGRAREAGEINKSLLTLGRVINALVERSAHIPYRDSKLTRLLKDDLGGETKTCIIAMISPSTHCLEETLSSLDYAHLAKNIKKKPEVNQKMVKSVLIKDFYFEIDRLKQEVHVTRENNEIYVPKDRFLQDEAEKKVMLENIKHMEIDRGNKHLASERNWKLLNQMSLICSPKLRAQQFDILHKAVASATTQQEHHLKAMEEDMHLFVSSKIEAAEQLQDHLVILKTKYGSGIKSLGDLAGELDGNSQSVIGDMNTEVSKHSSDLEKVFGPSSQQKDLYVQTVCHGFVFDVLDAYTSTIFAYGQTRPGETYTTEAGSRKKNGDIPSNVGVIPRAIRLIFDISEAQNAKYSLKVTFLELYNVEITDVLVPEEFSKFIEDKSKKPIALLGDGKGGIFLRGLEDEIVTTADEIYKILGKGSAKRRTTETLLNKQSSPSHSVFSITIHIKECTPEAEEIIKCGMLNLVNLVGSESISHSSARVGRAREAGVINKSLLTIGRVINSFVEHSAQIPYRPEQVEEPDPEAIPKAVGSLPTEESVVDAPQEIDEYDDLVGPIDILKPLEKSGFWEEKASKWCERKEAVLNRPNLHPRKRLLPVIFKNFVEH